MKSAESNLIVGLLCLTCAVWSFYFINNYATIYIGDNAYYAGKDHNWNSIIKDEYPISTNDKLNDCVTYTTSVKFTSIFKPRVLEYSRAVDEEDLHKFVDDYNKLAKKSSDAYIKAKDDKSAYTIIKEVNGTEIDYDSLYKYMCTNKDKPIQVNLENFYIKPKVLSKDLSAKCDELNKALEWKVSYTKDFTIKPTTDDVYIDSSGNVIKSDKFIDKCIKDVAAKYDTIGMARNFTTVNGNNIVVTGGAYGSEVDRAEEVSAVKELFNSNKSQSSRVPVLSKDKDDLTNTYVEISIADQHMWYVQEGNVVFDTDIVTGCVAKGHDTPKGTFYIMEHLRHHIMRGDDYAVEANYWMRLTNSGVGIHDAPARRAFGGSIYLTSGSHGCINTPPAKVAELYKLTSTGCPVVIY